LFLIKVFYKVFISFILYKIYVQEYLSLVDTNIESENSGPEFWSPTSPESSSSINTTAFDFNIPNSSLSSELDNNRDLSFIENFSIDEKYIIIGDKLGK
jgi:hypothetical protein